MKKFLLIIMILLFIFNISFGAKKNITKSTTVNKPVVERLKNIRRITADFIQTTKIKNFNEETYKGKLYLIAGEKALWDYNYPYKQYYLFDKKGMEYYDSSTNQVIVQNKNSSREANIILTVLFNFKEIESNFDIVVNGKSQIQLKPKQDIGLKYIMLIVDSKNNIKGIHSEDINGNISEIEFNNVEINKDINLDVFKVKHPADAQIFNY
ncbi:LolA family protein [Calditerrivibrio sp.]|uniref:LolA family protein n=1 Tax=Calditerrivibrio sp. TaxID=2792612 RepID=UPI003D0EC222